MTTNPTPDLRERIAEVLWALTDWDGDRLNAKRAADAVLAVLPPPADRAVVRDALRRADEADARAAAMERAMESTAAAASAHRFCHMQLVAQCRRAEQAEAEAERLRADRAAEAQQQPSTETPAQPCDGCGHPIHPARECPVTRYGERCACDEPIAAVEWSAAADTNEESATETVHACPPDGSGLTPCCGRTPFELPPTDRMTTDLDAVTCRGGEEQPGAADTNEETHRA